MDINISKVWEAGKKTKALALSVGVGIAATAGATFLDDPVDAEDPADDFEQTDAPKEVDSQIDQNSQKLESIADDSNNQKTNYTLLGC